MKAKTILRISAPIMAISLVPLAVGVGAAFHIHGSQKTISNALALNVTSMRSSEEIAINMRDQVVLGLTLLGVCGQIAGLLAGFGISRGVTRSLVRISVPIRNAAGKLNEVVGPITFAAGVSLDELEAVLHRMAAQIGSVIE